MGTKGVSNVAKKPSASPSLSDESESNNNNPKFNKSKFNNLSGKPKGSRKLSSKKNHSSTPKQQQSEEEKRESRRNRRSLNKKIPPSPKAPPNPKASNPKVASPIVGLAPSAKKQAPSGSENSKSADDLDYEPVIPEKSNPIHGFGFVDQDYHRDQKRSQVAEESKTSGVLNVPPLSQTLGGSPSEEVHPQGSSPKISPPTSSSPSVSPSSNPENSSSNNVKFKFLPQLPTPEKNPQPTHQPAPPLIPSPQTHHVVKSNVSYDILGVSVYATSLQIKKAYRAQARLWHPDKNFNHDVAKIRCQEICLCSFM